MSLSIPDKSSCSKLGLASNNDSKEALEELKSCQNYSRIIRYIVGKGGFFSNANDFNSKLGLQHIKKYTKVLDLGNNLPIDDFSQKQNEELKMCCDNMLKFLDGYKNSKPLSEEVLVYIITQLKKDKLLEKENSLISGIILSVLNNLSSYSKHDGFAFFFTRCGRTSQINTLENNISNIAKQVNAKLNDEETWSVTSLEELGSLKTQVNSNARDLEDSHKKLQEVLESAEKSFKDLQEELKKNEEITVAKFPKAINVANSQIEALINEVNLIEERLGCVKEGITLTTEAVNLYFKKVKEIDMTHDLLNPVNISDLKSAVNSFEVLAKSNVENAKYITYKATDKLSQISKALKELTQECMPSDYGEAREMLLSLLNYNSKPFKDFLCNSQKVELLELTIKLIPEEKLLSEISNILSVMGQGAVLNRFKDEVGKLQKIISEKSSLDDFGNILAQLEIINERAHEVIDELKKYENSDSKYSEEFKNVIGVLNDGKSTTSGAIYSFRQKVSQIKSLNQEIEFIKGNSFNSITQSIQDGIKSKEELKSKLNAIKQKKVYLLSSGSQKNDSLISDIKNLIIETENLEREMKQVNKNIEDLEKKQNLLKNSSKAWDGVFSQVYFYLKKAISTELNEIEANISRVNSTLDKDVNIKPIENAMASLYEDLEIAKEKFLQPDVLEKYKDQRQELAKKLGIAELVSNSFNLKSLDLELNMDKHSQESLPNVFKKLALIMEKYDNTIRYTIIDLQLSLKEEGKILSENLMRKFGQRINPKLFVPEAQKIEKIYKELNSMLGNFVPDLETAKRAKPIQELQQKQSKDLGLTVGEGRELTHEEISRICLINGYNTLYFLKVILRGLNYYNKNHKALQQFKSFPVEEVLPYMKRAFNEKKLAYNEGLIKRALYILQEASRSKVKDRKPFTKQDEKSFKLENLNGITYFLNAFFENDNNSPKSLSKVAEIFNNNLIKARSIEHNGKRNVGLEVERNELAKRNLELLNRLDAIALIYNPSNPKDTILFKGSTHVNDNPSLLVDIYSRLSARKNEEGYDKQDNKWRINSDSFLANIPK